MKTILAAGFSALLFSGAAMAATQGQTAYQEPVGVQVANMASTSGNSAGAVRDPAPNYTVSPFTVGPVRLPNGQVLRDSTWILLNRTGGGGH